MTKYEPHQMRVVEEKKALDTKIKDLNKFREAPFFLSLHAKEQTRLTDELFKITDGTNTSISSQKYTAGIPQDVTFTHDGVNMKIIVDGIDGNTVPFVGTFTPGDTLKYALGNEDRMNVVNISVSEKNLM